MFGGGETYRRRFPDDIAGFVRPYLLRVFPQLAGTSIDYAWGGTLAITLSRLPHIGRLMPQQYFAHGFSGHGVATGCFAGKLVAEAIAGDHAGFDLFAALPIRSFSRRYAVALARAGGGHAVVRVEGSPVKWLSMVFAGSRWLDRLRRRRVDDDARELRIYNWSDYIAPDTIARFEAETGIRSFTTSSTATKCWRPSCCRVRQAMTSWCQRRTSWVARSSPVCFSRWTARSCANYGNLDPELMALIARFDPDNRYGVPYLWGTTGLGTTSMPSPRCCRTDAPAGQFRPGVPPEYLSKLAGCGVAFLDAPQELFATVLHYLGFDPNSTDPEVYQNEARAALWTASALHHIFPLVAIHQRPGQRRHLHRVWLVGRHSAGCQSRGRRRAMTCASCTVSRARAR